jgi:shikimate kinase
LPPKPSGFVGSAAYNPQMQRVSRLILTGFMGAGKSTVGPILARELGWKFADLDDVIEALSQRTVAEIFRDYGEAEFRQRERQAVLTLIGQKEIVLALGGGTVEDESTRSLLVQSPGNCVVFLHAELPELLARCTVEGKTRPLLAAPEALEDRHKRRLPHYRAAHITVTTTGLAPEEVADLVLTEVRKRASEV